MTELSGAILYREIIHDSGNYGNTCYLFKLELGKYKKTTETYICKKWELIYHSYPDEDHYFEDLKGNIIVEQDDFSLNNDTNDFIFDISLGAYWIVKDNVCLKKDLEKAFSRTYEFYLKTCGTEEEERAYLVKIKQRRDKGIEEYNNKIKGIREDVEKKIKDYEKLIDIENKKYHDAAFRILGDKL